MTFGLPRSIIVTCEGNATWWNQSPDEGLSVRILEAHVVLFQCAVWLIDWLELFVLSYRKLRRSCAALRMTSLSSMFACAHAIHAAHHSMCVFCVFHDCIDVLHRSEVATASGLTREERRETITAVKDMARALRDVVQKK